MLASTESVIESMLFQPGQDRIRPTVVELIITLPPKSLTTIKYDFDRAFIKYTEHPPDANRGFDIGFSFLMDYF
jgi:phosphatidylinositol glycan class T